MRVEITRDEKGRCSGFRMVCENIEDSKTLGSIRNSVFFGKPFTYQGQTSLDTDKGSFAVSLNFGSYLFSWPETEALEAEKLVLKNIL